MKRKYPRSVVIVWEDHWYDPDGEITSEIAKLEGSKGMLACGFLVCETETQVELALDCPSEGIQTFRHRAFYDKRMIKEIIEMRPYRRKKRVVR